MTSQFKISGPASLRCHKSLFQVCRNMIETESENVELDLRRVIFYEPFGICTLAAVLEYLKHSKKRGVLLYRKDRPPANYLREIGFLEFFGSFESDSKLSTNKINLIQFKGTDDKVLEMLLEIIRGAICVNEAALDPLHVAFSEIMENVRCHAESPIDGLVVGQIYKKNKLLKICFVDMGIGIRQSMIRNPQYIDLKSDVDAVLKAIEESVTSKPRQHSGLGLSETASFIRENRGVMTIISDSAYVEIGEKIIAKHLTVGFTGTIINLEIPLNRQQNIHQMTFEEAFDELWTTTQENEK